jgi:hypothetical protein
MAQIRLSPLTDQQAFGRSTFGGAMSGSGFGGNDYLCGHCGTVMFADFDLHTLIGDYVFQCHVCSGFTERPTEEMP